MSYKSGKAITTTGQYEIGNLADGENYGIEVFFANGATGTIAPKQLAPNNSRYQTIQIDGSDISLTDSGRRSFRHNASSQTIQFDVTAISGTIWIKLWKIGHGK
jgi:hypothetical protein